MLRTLKEIREERGVKQPDVAKHSALTWGFVFSYPNLSQVCSFFGVRGGEILG